MKLWREGLNPQMIIWLAKSTDVITRSLIRVEVGRSEVEEDSGWSSSATNTFSAGTRIVEVLDLGDYHFCGNLDAAHKEKRKRISKKERKNTNLKMGSEFSFLFHSLNLIKFNLRGSGQGDK